MQSVYLGPSGSTLFDDDASFMTMINNMPTRPGETGKVWKYNGLTYGLASMVIDKLSNSSFEEFLIEKLFLPIGMTSTDMMPGENSKPEHKVYASPYIIASDGTAKEISYPAFGQQSRFGASCGLRSSVEDMIIWAKFVVAHYRERNTTSLSPLVSSLDHIPQLYRTFEPVCTFSSTPNGAKISYAMGWFHVIGMAAGEELFQKDSRTVAETAHCTAGNLDGSGSKHTTRTNAHEVHETQKVLFHSGQVHGFTSSLHIYPDAEHAVVVLGNSTGNGSSETVELVSKVLNAVVCGEAFFPEHLEGEAHSAVRLGKSIYDYLAECDCRSNTDSCKLKLCQREVLGLYFNDRFGLYMTISAGSTGTECGDVPLDISATTFVSFHPRRLSRLPLRHHANCVYSFLPPRSEWEKECLYQFHDHSQYLLHMDFDDDDYCIGAWWQYERESDAIWFGRLKV